MEVAWEESFQNEDQLPSVYNESYVMLGHADAPVRNLL